MDLLPKEWVEVHAKIAVEYDEEYQGNVPILYADDVTTVDALADEFVYFN